MPSSRRRAARHLAVNVTIAALVAAGAFLLLRTVDDDDDGSAPTPPASVDGRGQVLDAIAAELARTSGGLVDAEQGRCVADELLGTLGTDALVELGLDESPLAAELRSSPATRDAMLAALVTCVPAETIGELLTEGDPAGGGLPDEG